MKPQIEIVSHCWSGEAVPVYHALLSLQLSSLILATARPAVLMTVCCSANDDRTNGVLEWFEGRLRRSHLSQRLEIRRLVLPDAELFRRAIGRNRAARATEAEVVWFTDCDYCFGPGCLAAAHDRCRRASTDMIFPRTVWINRTHDMGDRLIRAAGDGRRITRLPPGEFYARTERRAWGGLQIVRGEWCRENGYLDGTGWQEPVDPTEGFRSCRGDVPFRKAVGRYASASIPFVYRVRHSRAGRDGGEVNHGAKTQEP